MRELVDAMMKTCISRMYREKERAGDIGRTKKTQNINDGRRKRRWWRICRRKIDIWCFFVIVDINYITRTWWCCMVTVRFFCVSNLMRISGLLLLYLDVNKYTLTLLCSIIQKHNSHSKILRFASYTHIKW